jgi:hypothetical protein
LLSSVVTGFGKTTMNLSQRKSIFRMLILAALILGCITFTPLVIPYGKYEPALFHFPYTLWTGLIVTLLFVLLTWIAIRIHPGKGEDES